ncbi:MAG: HAAS signaling domain-containing protein [Candidatus Heimdallarchaeaceae archaeon]
MSNIQEQETLVKEFKEQVVKKLPIWIKTNSIEREDVLEELESHIWDKAEELSQGGIITSLHVREAIALMGSPREIAKEYRRRGTPKIYITEELFPWYYKSIIIISSVIIFGHLLTMAFSFGGENTALQVVGEFFSGSAIGVLFGFVGVTILFVQLSMNGFLPEDLKKVAADKGTLGISVEKPEVKLVKVERKAEKKAKRKGILDSQGSYIFMGVMAISGGFFLLLYPIATLPAVVDYVVNPEAFTQWLRLIGALILAQGVFRFGQALAGENKLVHQVMMVLHIASSCLFIPLMLQLQYNPDIIISTLQSVFYYHPAEKIQLYVIIASCIFAVVHLFLGIDELRKLIQLEVTGFSQKG